MIERAYPGVYVVEMSSHMNSIDGVPTSTAGLAAVEATAAPHPAVPPWTDRNPIDPGTTQLELFTWIADAMVTRDGSWHRSRSS